MVIGAGFAGLAVCESLAKTGADLDVVLVDRHNYNTLKPLLYQVATAGLNPVTSPFPYGPTPLSAAVFASAKTRLRASTSPTARYFYGVRKPRQPV